jgi:hypothetical protein
MTLNLTFTPFIRPLFKKLSTSQGDWVGISGGVLQGQTDRPVPSLGVVCDRKYPV